MFKLLFSFAVLVAISGCGDTRTVGGPDESESADADRLKLTQYCEVELRDGTFLRLFRVDRADPDTERTTLFAKHYIELDHVNYEPISKHQQPLKSLAYSFSPDTTDTSWTEFSPPKEQGELTLFVFHYRTDIDSALVEEPIHFTIESESESYAVAAPPPKEFTPLFFDPLSSRFSEVQPQRQPAGDSPSTADTTADAG